MERCVSFFLDTQSDDGSWGFISNGNGLGTLEETAFALQGLLYYDRNVQRGTIEVVVVVPPSGIGGPPEPLVETFTFHAGGRFRFDGVGGSILTTTLTGEGNTDYGLIATTGPIEVLPENPYLPLGPLPTVLPVSPTSNGWELFSFSCRDGSNPGAGIDVSPGENVVCDFFFYIPQIP